MVDINWNAVYGFWLVAQHGSFADAARVLPRGSVQALHKRIRTLESGENLNLRLLRSRGTRGVELTAAGRRLFELVSPLFGDFDRLVAELQGEDSGPLYLAATGYSSHNYVSDMVAAFSRKYPNVSIHLALREPADIVELLESGRVDFAICGPVPGLRSCEVKASAPVRIEIIMPPGHRLRKGIDSWRELLQEPLILPERGSRVREAFDNLMDRETLRGELRLKAEMTSPDLAVEAVRAGVGVALVAVGPRLDLRGVARAAPPPGLPPLRLAIMCRKNRYLPEYMKRFVDIARGILLHQPPVSTLHKKK